MDLPTGFISPTAPCRQMSSFSRSSYSCSCAFWNKAPQLNAPFGNWLNLWYMARSFLDTLFMVTTSSPLLEQHFLEPQSILANSIFSPQMRVSNFCSLSLRQMHSFLHIRPTLCRPLFCAEIDCFPSMTVSSWTAFCALQHLKCCRAGKVTPYSTRKGIYGPATLTLVILPIQISDADHVHEWPTS